MDVTELLEQLRGERDRVWECIRAIELLAADKPRRGRPPKWIVAAKATASPAEDANHAKPAKRKRGRPPATRS